MSEAEPLCYCKKQKLNPEDATYVLRGNALCNYECLKKAEREILSRDRAGFNGA